MVDTNILAPNTSGTLSTDLPKLPLYNPLFKPTIRRIVISALKAWSTGYATACVPKIVSLVLKQLLGGAKRPGLRDLSTKIITVLFSSFRARMPWFFMALIGGFRAFDRLSWEVVEKLGNEDSAKRDVDAHNSEWITDGCALIAKASEQDMVDFDNPPKVNGIVAGSDTVPPVTEVYSASSIPPPSHIVTPTFLAATLSSALALLIVPAAQRGDFAIFTMVRAIDSLASFQGTRIRDALRARSVPEVLIRNADSVVFIACCTQIMFCWIMFPQALPKQYVKWIDKMGRTDPRILEAVRLLGLGVMKNGVDTGHAHLLGDYAVEIGRSFAEGDPANGQISCTLIHRGAVGCTRNLLGVWKHGFGDAMKIYIPVHLLPAIIFHRRRFTNKKQLAETVQHVAVAAAQSSAFIATFICLVWIPICFCRNTFKTDTMLGPLLGSFASGFSIFIERKSRRREIGLYCLPKALESAWWLITRGNVKIPGADVVMFATGMGYLLSAYQYHPKALRPAVRGVLGFFLV
ncbi:hypothetical protein DFJ77DRAFT_462871 [Powellomyces hirtus]|nr:hypothetical protein DFJ77DRAFT_462871 [Powellomyces hirtus]